MSNNPNHISKKIHFGQNVAGNKNCCSIFPV